MILILANVLPLGSSVNTASAKGMGFRFDYLLHVLGCMALPLMLLIDKNNSQNLISNNAKTIHLLLVSLILVSAIEIIQILIPYRTFNYRDLISNISGFALGAFILFL